MAVSFNRHGRLYYLDPSGVEPAPRVGDQVLVPTTTAPEVAEVVWAGEWVDGVEGLPVCAGHAGPGHLARDERSRRKRAEILSASRRSIREAGLPMKVTAVDWVEEQTSATVYFTAPHRVDFRQLVRDLDKTLRLPGRAAPAGRRATRPACRAASARAGATPAARPSSRTSSRSRVRMAKDQDLPLNPLKISGACGRLMCCLKYEHPLYLDFKADAPAYGDSAYTSEGAGTVVGMNVPAGTISIRLADDRQADVVPEGRGVRLAREYEERQARARLSGAAPGGTRGASRCVREDVPVTRLRSRPGPSALQRALAAAALATAAVLALASCSSSEPAASPSTSPSAAGAHRDPERDRGPGRGPAAVLRRSRCAGRAAAATSSAPR